MSYYQQLQTHTYTQMHLDDNCKTCFPTLLLRPVESVCVCVVSRQAQHVLRRKFPKQNTHSSTGRRAALLILTDYPTSVLFPFSTSLSLTHTLTFSHSLSVVLGLFLVTQSRSFSLLFHTPLSWSRQLVADCCTTTVDHISVGLTEVSVPYFCLLYHVFLMFS